MKHQPRNDYDKEALLQCGKGQLFGPDNAKLPLPPMLMFDRITLITSQGGKYDKGFITAELDIQPDLWFFGCHFQDDPVMPGCLGVDAVWQLLGFFLAWSGYAGRGRALGSGDIRFSGQVTPDKKKVAYRVDVSRVISSKLVMGVADGEVRCDGELIYTIKRLKVALF